MKLIFCNECKDVVQLRYNIRYCECGESGGHYVDDLNAKIWGPCIKIGFANGSFGDALYWQKTQGDSDKMMPYGYGYVTKGRPFDAFLIPESAETMIRVEKPKDVT